MADLSLLLEAEKRGILPPDRIELLNEARRRGIIDASPSVSTPEIQQPAKVTDAPITTVPDWARRNPSLYGLAGAAREVLAPIAEAGGMVAGGLLGAPAGGPIGGAVGAGLGYGIGKGAVRMADVALGNEQPESVTGALSKGAGDVMTGTAMDAGGRLLAPVIGSVVKGAGNIVGKVSDLFADRGRLKAADIVRKSLGAELQPALAAFKNAPSDISAGQAIADVNSPTTQALLARAMERDPQFLTNLMGKQEAARFSQLSLVAKASNQTAAKQAQAEMKDILNKNLIPVLETELSAANLAGEMGPKFKSDVERFAQAAANKVQDVRRFTAAGERAHDIAPPMFGPSGSPIPSRYTYVGGDLAKRAEQVATDSAEGSLRFGEAAQFANAALKSLEAHGLKPLTTESIVGNISKTVAKPEFAGNRDIQAVLGRVSEDLAQWTNSGGVIDAFALDSIRKNSVNSAIKALYPAAESKVQKELAAKILGQVRPLIVDAIEGAGGTGYRGYLDSYSKGMQQIGQTKLGAEAMRLYQSSPESFVKLVEGNSPKAVEKVFGPGNYNIAKEMSKDAMGRLNLVAGEVKRDANVANQVKAGEAALNELLDSSISKFQIPNVLNPKIAMANRGLRELEKKIGKNAMIELTNAAKSGKSMAELINTFPPSQKLAVIQAMKNPQSWMPNVSAITNAPSGLAPSVANALAEE